MHQNKRSRSAEYAAIAYHRDGTSTPLRQQFFYNERLLAVQARLPQNYPRYFDRVKDTINTNIHLVKWPKTQMFL